jgi:hypothetical protein
MKRYIYAIALVLFCINTYAQQDYFIFIQQTSGQPFYVRMGEQSFSSSSGGHIILSGLKDSSYSLYVGFPKNMGPEQLFVVPVHMKDRGFELKNMNNEWQLFDLQSLQFLKAVASQINSNASGAKKTDSYSALMAGVVDDSAVLYGGAVKKEPVKAHDSLGSVKSSATPKITRAPVKATDTATGRIAADKPAAPAGTDIIRYGSENVEEGKLIIYIDRTAPVSDTIRIIIPRL